MLRNGNTFGANGWFPGYIVGLVVAVCGLQSPARGVETDLAREAYMVAQNWVTRNAAPEHTLPVRVTGLSAVHATLRLEGAMVGQATVAGEQPPEGLAIDVMPLVASAVKQAMEDARATLGSQGVALEAGNKVVLDLQFGGPLEPLKLGKLADLPRHITPNADGLALEESGKIARSFPGNAVAANTNLNGHINRLVEELKLPLDRKPLIGTDKGPKLSRFDVVHVTRPAAGGQATTLYRGNEPLPAEALDDQSLALLGELLADHLVQRQRKDGRFAGTYEPTPDRYQPETADALSSAAAVYALARAAKLDGVEREPRERVAGTGLEAVVQLIGRVEEGNRQVAGRDLEATAWTLLAILESPGGSDFKEARDRMTASLIAMQDQDGRLKPSTGSDAAPANPSAQSLAAAAMVRAFDQSRDPRLLTRIERLARALADTPEEEEHRLFPWFVVAVGDLRRLEHPIEQASKLDGMCKRMWGRQVKALREQPGRVSPDTIGGFLVGNRLIPEPAYDSAWILAGLAVAMRQPGLVEDKERSRWLVNAGMAARFLEQLTFQPSSAYYTHNPREAIGGLRLALWDNREPLEATAAALLAVTELRLTLAQWARK